MQIATSFMTCNILKIIINKCCFPLTVGFLIVLDAKDLTLIGHATGSDLTLFGLHNKFIPSGIGGNTEGSTTTTDDDTNLHWVHAGQRLAIYYIVDPLLSLRGMLSGEGSAVGAANSVATTWWMMLVALLTGMWLSRK